MKLRYFLLCVGFQGCGEAPAPSYTPQPNQQESADSLQSTPDAPVPAEPSSPQPKPPKGWSLLSWDLECEQHDEQNNTIYGYGNHFVKKQTDQILIKVGVCPSKIRTVIIAVDVSRHAATVDPYVNDRCSRVQSIHQILDGLAEDTPVELIGFDSVPRYELQALSKTQLISELRPRSICGYYSATQVRLEAGLSAVEKRVQTLPMMSRKNVYLITTGKSFLPNDGQAAAQRLHKSHGLTLSTISFLQHQSYLSEHIATQTRNQQPLAHIMSKEGALSTSELLFPTDDYTLLVRYKSVWEQDFEEIYVADLKSYELDIRDYSTREGGLDLEVSYWNNMGESYDYEARLVWE